MWESYATWDRNKINLHNDLNESTDTHESEEEAVGVVFLLRKFGFGGEGRIFPITSGVRRVK